MDTIKVGDVKVSSIIERDGPVRPPMAMYPLATPEAVARAFEMLPDFTYDAKTEMLVITYQTYILRTPTCTAVIDTCVGEHPGYPAAADYDKTPWLNGLAAHGLTFEDIDYVFCTHLHIDHVGWNTRLIDGRHVPTFPNAKYLFSKKEYEHWKKTEDPMVIGPSFEACISPVVEAGQALLVDDDYFLSDELALLPCSGHSPGHVCVRLTSRGEEAIFTGDMMHHAIQCIEPDWSTIFCTDPDAAAATRRRFLGKYAGTDTLFLPAHFPAPSAGHIRQQGESWRFDFFSP